MASSLLASTYCSPACLHSRTQAQPCVSASVSGSILAKPLAALINKRPLFSAVHIKSLAHPSIPLSMSLRTRSPVIAKVSQTESKPDSKQEGQPPEENFYIAVTVSLTYVLKQMHRQCRCMHCLAGQTAQSELPLHESPHSSITAVFGAC